MEHIDTDFTTVTATDVGYSNNLVYFPPNDRFYYLTRGEPVGVLEIAFDRAAMSATVTRVDVPDPPNNPNETGWAYDDEHQIIGGGVAGGQFLAFDPAAKTWTARTMTVDSADAAVPDLAFHALDYDPVDGVFLWLSAPDRRTWAYRFE